MLARRRPDADLLSPMPLFFLSYVGPFVCLKVRLARSCYVSLSLSLLKMCCGRLFNKSLVVTRRHCYPVVIVAVVNVVIVLAVVVAAAAANEVSLKVATLSGVTLSKSAAVPHAPPPTLSPPEGIDERLKRDEHDMFQLCRPSRESKVSGIDEEAIALSSVRHRTSIT